MIAEAHTSQFYKSADHASSMSSDAADSSQSQRVQDEIADLEERLEKAKARLNNTRGALPTPPSKVPSSDGKKDFPYVQLLC